MSGMNRTANDDHSTKAAVGYSSQAPVVASATSPAAASLPTESSTGKCVRECRPPGRRGCRCLCPVCLRLLLKLLRLVEEEPHAAERAPDLSIWADANRLRSGDLGTWERARVFSQALLWQFLLPVGYTCACFLLPFAPARASFWENWVFNFVYWPLLTLPSQGFAIFWLYLVCSFDRTLKPHGVKTGLLAAVLGGILIGMLGNLLYCLVIWRGTEPPIPAHFLVVPPFAFIVTLLLSPFAVFRAKRRHDRAQVADADNGGADHVPRRLDPAPLHQQGRSMSQKASPSCDAGARPPRPSRESLVESESFRRRLVVKTVTRTLAHVVASRSDNNLSLSRARTSSTLEERAAQKIQEAYKRHLLQRVLRYRRRNSYGSMAKVAFAAIVPCTVYWLLLAMIMTYPVAFMGFPGGPSTVALLLPLIEIAGNGVVLFLLRQVNLSMSFVCTHMITALVMTSRLFLFGSVTSSQALMLQIGVIIVKWAYHVVSVHPRYTALVYSDSYSDSLWKRFHIQSQGLRMVVAYFAKIFAFGAWSATFVVQNLGPNRSSMVCEWMQRLNFSQAIRFAIIELGVETGLFVGVAFLLRQRCFRPHQLYIQRMILLVTSRKRLRLLIAVQHFSTVAASTTMYVHHAGLYAVQSVISQSLDSTGAAKANQTAPWDNGTAPQNHSGACISF